MDISKITSLFHTIRYLKLVQVYYRIYYLFRNKLIGREPKRIEAPICNPIFWNGGIYYSNRYTHKNSFEFLNIKNRFSNKIDWNFDAHGKLWTYNLNYFDFLNQSYMPKKLGLKLIQDYIDNEDSLIDGKDPYPTSLRLINWVKFLSNNKIKEIKIDEVLFHHVRILSYNLEYHLLANHLLENAFAILFGSYYFQNEKLYRISKKLLISQLNEQILNDGAHYELSPMYHQILLHRLLDCINLIELNNTWKNDELLSFMKRKASEMRSWLENVTYKNGEIPMVSDTAFYISPSTNELTKYADNLKISSKTKNLNESGYRMIIKWNFELFIDVGNIQPSYQPGHSHSDTFHFDLYKNRNPILVDMGISTYEKNKRRDKERSTSSHNTITINDKNQTDVWGGFRVGRRAKVIKLIECDHSISAIHDGYKKQGFLHKRIFNWKNKNTLLIKDKIQRSTENKAVASFHFHSSIDKPKFYNNRFYLPKYNITIGFKGDSHIVIKKYDLPIGYNKYKSAYKIMVTFEKSLQTHIYL